MTVQVSKVELEQFIEEQVRAGHFVSREAVIEAALAQMMLRDEEGELDEETLAAIDESEAQIARGDVHDWKEVSAELREKIPGPVTYRIHITSRALADLTGIFEFIREHSPQNARTVTATILDAIDDLDFMPSRFKVAGKSRSTGLPVHSRVVKPYVVYYRVEDSPMRVFILEVRHGARRPKREFD